MKNRTAIIHMSLSQSRPGAVYKVDLSGVHDYGENLDDIEMAINALIMSITHSYSSWRGVLHTRTMSLCHAPREILDNADDIDANIVISKSAITIRARTVDGDEWSSIVPHDYFSVIPSFNTSDDRDGALKTLNEQRDEQRLDMMYHIGLDAQSTGMKKSACLNHAFLCAMLAYGARHKFPLPHHAVFSYILYVLLHETMSSLGMDEDSIFINRVELSDYFSGEYIAWSGLREGGRIKTLDGFDDYQSKFPPSMMAMMEEIVPLVFLMHEDAAHLRHIEMVKDSKADIFDPKLEIDKGQIHASSHQMMEVVMLEEKIKAIITAHQQSLLRLSGQSKNSSL